MILCYSVNSVCTSRYYCEHPMFCWLKRASVRLKHIRFYVNCVLFWVLFSSGDLFTICFKVRVFVCLISIFVPCYIIYSVSLHCTKTSCYLLFNRSCSINFVSFECLAVLIEFQTDCFIGLVITTIWLLNKRFYVWFMKHQTWTFLNWIRSCKMNYLAG